MVAGAAGADGAVVEEVVVVAAAAVAAAVVVPRLRRLPVASERATTGLGVRGQGVAKLRHRVRARCLRHDREASKGQV